MKIPHDSNDAPLPIGAPTPSIRKTLETTPTENQRNRIRLHERPLTKRASWGLQNRYRSRISLSPYVTMRSLGRHKHSQALELFTATKGD
jgi:hypothetical protein